MGYIHTYTHIHTTHTYIHTYIHQARIQDFLQGGVNDGRVLRAPLASAPTGGLGLINIRLRYIASIEYSERFFLIFFFWLVKKFVEKQNWWSRAGGGHDPQNPPPGSAPVHTHIHTYVRTYIHGRFHRNVGQSVFGAYLREERVRESFNGVYQVRFAESFQGIYTFMGLTSKLLLLELKNMQFRGCFRP